MATLPVITQSMFESEVLNSSLPVLVDVYADWCGPCKMLGPQLENMATENAGKLKIVKVDADVEENIPLLKEMGVQALPTCVFYVKGKKTTSIVGAHVAKIEETIASIIGT